MTRLSLGLKEALALTLEHIKPLTVERVVLKECVGRITASDLYARVDSPSVDAARKDGYAVVSGDIDHATSENPVRLRVAGSMAAGCATNIPVSPGTAVRVFTGAPVPTGADAVVAEEFTTPEGDDVIVGIFAEPGRNILPRGRDVTFGTCILPSGWQISPGAAGLLAAAGHSRVPVFRRPVVGIIGTGDEIVEPGTVLTEGKLYASNVVTLAGWCSAYKMKTLTRIVGDDHDAIRQAIKDLLSKTDVIVTSGGAWTGDHDLIARVLKTLGWNVIFHHIRIGPGKPVGFGTISGKPLFVLPGGPSSNMTGFLQIVLPGLLALSGRCKPELPAIKARLASTLAGREPGWTDFFYGTLVFDDIIPTFYPSKEMSALAAIAEASAIASIPEGRDNLPEGAIISVQLLK